MAPNGLSSTKKRKNVSDSPSGPATKKSKQEKKKDKGKSKAITTEDDTDFRTIQASLMLSIPPRFAQDLRQGALELLDSMIMRYIPALEGVVLAHSNLRFLDHAAKIVADSPYLVCNVSFDATVWGPRIGMTLEGYVNLCSPDHVSLLIHRTFNASIPRHHIPSDQWQFEYGPAENDPEYGPDAQQGADEEGVQPEVDEGGKWIDSLTGDPLGGSSKRLRFTVIGLTVANEMLSLTGSIQPDPFSPAHVPEHRHSIRPSVTDDEFLDDRPERPDRLGSDDGEFGTDDEVDEELKQLEEGSSELKQEVLEEDGDGDVQTVAPTKDKKRKRKSEGKPERPNKKEKTEKKKHKKQKQESTE